MQNFKAVRLSINCVFRIHLGDEEDILLGYTLEWLWHFFDYLSLVKYYFNRASTDIQLQHETFIVFKFQIAFNKKSRKHCFRLFLLNWMLPSISGLQSFDLPRMK